LLQNFDFIMTIIKPNSILFYFLLIISAIGCDEDKSKQYPAIILNVATAANVQFAMKDIEAAFEQKYKLDINVIVGSSGKLTAQIKQGAPYDLLISANVKYPLHLYQEKFAPNPPKIYALGSLVLWTMKKELALEDKLSFLKGKEVNKIAIANPKNAPYGEQAIMALDHFGIKDAVTSKLVYAENIAQTNLYITTKNCEVGFTAKSVVMAPDLKEKGNWIAVPSTAYQPIEQGVVITKYGDSKHKEIAQKFYDFLFSLDAQNILKAYGYTMPAEPLNFE